MIQLFTIFGDKCSGTNFLEEAMLANFSLHTTADFGHKHYFPYAIPKNDRADRTLFLGIVRDPYKWLFSYYSNPFEIPRENRLLSRFLFAPYTSKLWNHTERYASIFEARVIKTRFLLQTMPSLVKHYYFVKYEDLRDNYNTILTAIETKFHLRRRFPMFQPIRYYKKNKNVTFQINTKTFDAGTLQAIAKRLDKQLEMSLGYLSESKDPQIGTS